MKFTTLLVLALVFASAYSHGCKCEEGKYMNNYDWLCKDPPVVENCKVFHQDRDKVVRCYYCNDGYYRDEDYTCKTNTQAIDKCIYVKKEGGQIKCAKCDEGYYPHMDHCMPVPSSLPGCIRFDHPSTGVVCTRCDSTTHYLMDGACVAHPSTVEHCSQYEWDATAASGAGAAVCAHCQVEYHLDAGACVANESSFAGIEGCTSYFKDGTIKCKYCDRPRFDLKDDSCNACPWVAEDNNSASVLSIAVLVLAALLI